MRRTVVMILAILLLAAGSSSCHRALPAPAVLYTYEVVHSYPHDSSAFTQGLVFHDGVLYESTGISGQSTLRKVDLETGEAILVHPLPPQYFGEGITLYKDRIIQLTWQSKVGFIYDKDSFRVLGGFTYGTEGWGITTDGERLIMSDGTSCLYLLHPDTFEEIGRIEVKDGAKPISRLNELEYIQGSIYANVWQTDTIAIISPQTGQVTGWIDLTGLPAETDRTGREDVLNGIAYDAEGKRLFVTGKLWSKLYEIRLVEKSNRP